MAVIELQSESIINTCGDSFDQFKRNNRKIGSKKYEGLDPQELTLDVYQNIFLTIINGWDIELNGQEELGLSAIWDSFNAIEDNGLPSGGINRQQLKDSLDEQKISNLVNIYTPTELSERNRLGNLRSELQFQADKLDLTPKKYKTLLQQANRAYDIYYQWGPLYGEGKEPTFRVAASPLELPQSIETQIQILGEDLSFLAELLPTLDSSIFENLGDNLWPTLEPTFRLDIILDNDNQIWLNEIQVSDGADALMTIEQIAYGLQTLDSSTAAHLSKEFINQSLRNIAIVTGLGTLDPKTNPYISNRLAMKELLKITSKGQLNVDVIAINAMKSNDSLSEFDGVILDGYYPVQKLIERFGLRPEQIISNGDSSYLGNKSLMALLFLPELADFWANNLGKDRLKRLQTRIPPTEFVSDREDLNISLDTPELVTKSFYDPQSKSITAMQGVFGLWSQPQERQKAAELWESGCKFIKQKLIDPQQLSVLIRKNSGRSLQKQTGPNRLCAKFVGSTMTAVEATIGLLDPDNLIKSQIIPADQGCCFTPVVFK